MSASALVESLGAPPSVGCVHPDWVGNDGIQCCQLCLSADDALVHCRVEWAGVLLGCLGAELALAAILRPAIVACALMPPPANVICLAGIFLIAAGLIWACIAFADLVTEGCVARVLHDNAKWLAANGCAPSPP